MKLYYGTYGHHLSGKLYVYWGDDNLRSGDRVVAPVTHKSSGKTYDTMFTISRAYNEKNAEREVSRLSGKGISIKTIGGRDLLSLPGGKGFDTKIAWKRESDARYRKKFGLSDTAEQARSALSSSAGSSATARSETAEKAKSALLRKETIESAIRKNQNNAFKE